MLKIKDFCTKDIVRVTSASTIKDVLKEFLKYKIDIGCVFDKHENLVGIISKNAVFRSIINGDDPNSHIKPYIKSNVVTVDANESMSRVRDIMLEKKVAHGVVLDENEHVLGVISKADIIRGFLSEKELLVNQLSDLITNLDYAVIAINSDGNIETINPTAEILFGVQKDHVINQSITKCIPQIADNLLDALQQQKIKKLQQVLMNNKTLIASYIPITSSSHRNGAMAVLQDITEIEQFANELEYTKNLKQMLQHAVSLSYDAIVICDKNGYITEVNESFFQIYPKNKNVINQHWSKGLNNLNLDKVLSGERINGDVRVLNGKACIIYQVPIIRNDQIQGAISKIIFRQLDEWKNVVKRLEVLENEVNYYKGELQKVQLSSNAFDRIISRNKEMEKIKRHAFLSSDSVSTILITGESGTGKELFAEAIHKESKRTGNFVKVNCAAIPSELLESEFFGYSDGAFTGAKKGGKKGKFELADEGTLFLDEIGDMPLSLQAKILRVLQEKTFERIGDLKTKKVDVRIIAATHRNLKQMVKDGLFREDLYYRIDVVSFNLPPLRNRIDDLPMLCDFLIKKLNQKLNKNVKGITPETLNIFENYHWPGNIRQLENVLERAMNMGVQHWIEPKHLPDQLNKHTIESNLTIFNQSDIKPKKTTTLEEVEKETIIDILQKTNYNRSETAKQLGISRSGLYKKLKKYGITAEVKIKSQ